MFKFIQKKAKGGDNLNSASGGVLETESDEDKVVNDGTNTPVFSST